MSEAATRARPAGEGSSDREVLRRARPAPSATRFAPPRPQPSEFRGLGALAWAERLFVVLALLAQQDAFLNILRILRGADSADPNTDPGLVDPLSSLLVLVTLIGLGALTLLHRRRVLESARRNVLSLALAGLAFVSAVWSVDAGLTVKRSVVYLTSVGLPIYVAARFGYDGGLRLAAMSFAVAAVSSLFMGLAVPSMGVMHFTGLEGTWRGVFSHKNNLAQSMLLGALMQAYLVARDGRRRRRHAAVLAVELLLLALSRSTTGLVVAALGLAVFSGYLAARQGGWTRRLLTAGAPLALALGGAVVVFAPQALQQASGKDATLSGRTELWAAVAQAIGERPLTGWGFQAFWDPGNPRVQDIWEQIGWLAPNAHNGFLDVTLGLGPLGFLLTFSVVLQGFIRAGRLLGTREAGVAGAETLVVLGAVTVASFTEAVFVRQGAIDWVVFNLVSFMAVELWSEVRPRPPAPAPALLARARPQAWTRAG